MTWPKFYPPNCPPNESEPSSETFIRFVDHNPPEQADFITYREINPCKHYKNECEACGISIHLERGQALSLRRTIPALAKKKIAFGKLAPECGVVLSTPSLKSALHHTWWAPDGLKSWTYFSVVDIIDDK